MCGIGLLACRRVTSISPVSKSPTKDACDGGCGEDGSLDGLASVKQALIDTLTRRGPDASMSCRIPAPVRWFLIQFAIQLLFAA